MLLRNNAVLWRELDGEAILLDPKEGCSYNLNAIGTLNNHLLTDVPTPSRTTV